MTFVRLTTLLATAIMSLALPLHAATQPTLEIRSHLALALPGSKTPAYVITYIEHPDDEFETSETFLILDADQKRFVVSWRRNYFDQTAIYEIRDFERDIFVRSTVQFPYLAKSKHETVIEAGSHNNPDLPITVEAGGARVTGTLTEWKSGLSRNLWRGQLRRGMDPQLLESIEEMRQLMHDQLFATTCSFLTTTLLFEEPCTTTSPYEIKALPPDCDFDASFGMKCSNEQRLRVADAIEKKTTIADY